MQSEKAGALTSSRIEELIATYSNDGAHLPYLLCDRHDPGAIAFTLISADLSQSGNLTFGELGDDSRRLASALAYLGIRAGDRVATLMGKSREYLVTLLAIWRLGAVHVPLFTAFAPQAIAFRLKASRCKVVFCDASQRDKVAHVDQAPAAALWAIVTTGEPQAGDHAFHELLARGRPVSAPGLMGGATPIIEMYTSGTTGTAKGVVIPLRAFAAFHAYAAYGLDLRADDVFWNAADPGWAYGLLFGICAGLLTGTRSILLEGGFSAKSTVEVLANEGVTVLAAAPTVYRSIKASGVAVPKGLKLRAACSAGEPLTPDVNEWALAELNQPVHDHYGQTECGMLVNNHFHQDVRRPLRTGSMGHPMPGWTAGILQMDLDEPAPPNERGRLAFELAASPLAWFNGYVDAPEKSSEKVTRDGKWYLTGDLARIDSDGYVSFASREDDVVIMAGYRIGPVDVEAALMLDSRVAECAVVAGPDTVRGEILEAFVVLRTGSIPSHEITVQLQEVVKDNYAAHAYPRRVHYVDALPKTPSGKVQRSTLRAQLWKESRRPSDRQGAQP